MNAKVQIHSDDPTGIVRTITIEQTELDSGHIDIKSSAAPASGQSYDLNNIMADVASLAMVCQVDAFLSASINVSIQSPASGNLPTATVTISHALFGDGVYKYTIRAGEDELVRQFLISANFPPIDARGG